MKIKSFARVTAVAALALLLLFVALWVRDAYFGNHKGHTVILPEFTLMDQHGQVVTKASMVGGKYTIVLFGFSRCPSICPIQLAALTRFLDVSMGESVFEKLQVYFITLDPENDTLLVLSEYSKSFHPKISMLTGSKQDIDNLVMSFRVYVQHDKEGDINHSSILYFIGMKGEFLSSLDISNEEGFYHDVKSRLTPRWKMMF